VTATDRATHWQNVYLTKGEQGVSWFEETPQLSLTLIAEAGFGHEAEVVDVGGGASRLVDALVAAGQLRVTVLDLSSAALEVARVRLAGAGHVQWVAGDVTKWKPDRQYDVWHDRAAFHFLTQPADQESYVGALGEALKPGGAAIIGTFAPDGPEKCSGLTVVRYDAKSLAVVLGKGFALEATRRHEHTTPWGAVQRFQFSTFRRTPS
jgi:2-polyprenyl-3-methyl-5-hydroxy-6-metoxy-1,4-benzoquinol methylase